MFARRVSWMMASLACVILRAVSPSFAAEGINDDVKVILNDGWKLNDDASKTAESHFDKAKAAAPDDVRPAYAMSLVQLRHEHLDAAVALLDAAVKEHPDDLQLRRTLVWLRAKRGEFPEMLKAISALSIRLPSVEAEGEPGLSDLAAAKMLGQLFGYFAGPGASRLTDAKLDQREKIISEAMSTPVRAAFQEGRDSVIQRFAGLQDGSVDAEMPAVEGGLKALSSGSPGDAKGKVSPERAVLEKKYNALREEYVNRETQAKAILPKVAAAEQSAKDKYAAAARDKNTKNAANLRKAGQKFLDDVKNDQRNLRNIEDEMKKVKLEALDVEKKHKALVAQDRADSIKAGEVKPEKPVDKNPADKKPPDVTNSNSKTDPEKLAAFETYIQLDLEAERQQVLATLGQ